MGSKRWRHITKLEQCRTIPAVIKSYVFQTILPYDCHSKDDVRLTLPSVILPSLI